MLLLSQAPSGLSAGTRPGVSAGNRPSVVDITRQAEAAVHGGKFKLALQHLDAATELGLHDNGAAAYRVLDSDLPVTSDACGVRSTPASKHPLHPRAGSRWLRLTISQARHLEGIRPRSVRPGVGPTGLNKVLETTHP